MHKKIKIGTAGLFKASETNILDPDELVAAKQMMSEDLYDQEFECSFKQLSQALIMVL